MKRGIWAWPPGNDNPTAAWTDSVIASAIAAKIDTIYWFGGGGYAMWPSDILPSTTPNRLSARVQMMQRILFCEAQREVKSSHGIQNDGKVI